MRRQQRRGGLLGATCLALTLVAACTSGGTGDGAGAAATRQSPTTGATATATSGTAAGELPRPDHVMVVVFENEDAADVVDSAEAPYLTSLSTSGAAFTDAHGETHPSQPNYLALFSGSTQGVTDDRCPQKLTGDNLASQLLATGQTFVGYSEDLPRAGYTGCSAGDYRRKHNPWVNFTGLPASVNQPFSALPTDYAQLPTVSFVVPNMCHDMHDCDVATGDTWAKNHLDRYVTWAKDHNSLLIVTFDEDSGTADNHIATIVVGAPVRATTSTQRINHYDVLRTLEDMYGLEPLGHAADAHPITGVWLP
ncbi:MAG: acid phosphatase [Modestobacter sp.]|jgi:hypothetical protein|nr:acid phosphatase [Modestobacter sp.]